MRGARRLVEETLSKWGLAPLVDDALVCVSELVTNVQQHAVHPLTGERANRTAEVGLRVFVPSELLLYVGDDDPRMPRLAGLDEWSESGRGLRNVAGLCDGWWPCRRSVGGKVIYVRFDISRYLGEECGGGAG